MEGDQVDWRQPDDAFTARLAAARDALLAAQADPSAAVAMFEPIIEELKYDLAAREAKLPRVRALGRELLAELRAGVLPVAMEVRHYCWHLQHLGHLSSLTDMLMVTLTRPHYAGMSSANLCRVPGDIPLRRPGGRALRGGYGRVAGNPHANMPLQPTVAPTAAARMKSVGPRRLNWR